MKTTIVLVFCFVAAAFADLYDTKYDNINLDDILRNEKLLDVYTNCLLDKGPCNTKEAKFLKEVLPEALINDCKKCSQKQMDGSKKVIEFLYRNKPTIWKELTAKYDPLGTYQKNHQAEFDKLNH
ncbi:unnamed protein product [Brassicogethes aeneus]|uniref:Uncharacterized protein n=1 Tax=Brassicogethes aeneus TaxID=1431903 RepID=A0A9P0FEE4_BRAAE|nr:unnamed protein product [Brassicogethes aeneus]